MTDNNNGWLERPGVPLNPERAGWHWLATSSGTPFAARWEPKYYDSADEWEWRIDGTFDDIEDAARNYRYLGPILTPSEIAAREAAAWCAGRDAAARYCHGRTTSRSFGSWADAFEAAERGIRALPLPDNAMAALEEMLKQARREEREAIAFDIDCGCGVKPIVLAKLASHGEREAWRCCGQHYDACLAVQAAAIRARGEAE